MLYPFQKKLGKIPIVKALASIKITVVCLFLLFILTLWGTIDQVSSGLYLAQERFFNSWGFIFWGFVPFPGARLVLWVLFINLTCASLIRLVYRWSKLGIIVIHIGLLTFFVAAFVTFHCVEESNITLREGEGTNVSSAYHHWEVSLWANDGDTKNVIAFDANHLHTGHVLDFKQYGISATVQAYYRSSEAYKVAQNAHQDPVVNASGIQSLREVSLNKEPEKNIPGGIFRLEGADQGIINVLLYGGEVRPISLSKEGKEYFLQLRLKRSQVPFQIRLKDFMMEKHPNTEMARSYKSLVEVTGHGATRDVLISMNEPMRYKDYTLYQASYAIDQFGREISTLAVVKNAGRLLPYIATFVTFAGLVIHLLMMAFPAKRKRRKASQ